MVLRFLFNPPGQDQTESSISQSHELMYSWSTQSGFPGLVKQVQDVITPELTVGRSSNTLFFMRALTGGVTLRNWALMRPF
jgi:hypothetical protein